MHGSPSDLLARVEANNWELLYRCRWSKAEADVVVPALADALASADRTILIRTLSALHRIGTEAASAIPAAIPLLGHADTVVREAAITMLAQVGLNQPSTVLPHILPLAAQEEHLSTVLFALIHSGQAAPGALPVVNRALGHSKGHMRRLALRALSVIAPAVDDVAPILERAANDPSAEVRAMALKLLKRRRAAT